MPKNQKAYDEGRTAATYSLGLAFCPYQFGTTDFQDWLDGYRYQYANS